MDPKREPTQEGPDHRTQEGPDPDRTPERWTTGPGPKRGTGRTTGPGDRRIGRELWLLPPSRQLPRVYEKCLQLQCSIWLGQRCHSSKPDCLKNEIKDLSNSEQTGDPAQQIPVAFVLQLGTSGPMSSLTDLPLKQVRKSIESIGNASASQLNGVEVAFLDPSWTLADLIIVSS